MYACRFGWKSGPRFLLDRYYRCNEKICCKATVKRQTVYYIQAWNICNGTECTGFYKANSGMIFQTFYLLDMGSSKLVALFYADASYSGASMTHQPIYSKFLFSLLSLLLNLFLLFMLLLLLYYFPVCLLNLNVEERSKPRNWIPVGWLPVYNEQRDKRPSKGFESTKDSIVPPVLDGISGRMGRKDQRLNPPSMGRWSFTDNAPVHWGRNRTPGGGRKYTGEPCMCHRWYAPRSHYLDTADYEVKTMRKVRQRVKIAYAGGFCTAAATKESLSGRPGPGVIAIIALF
jgi:hypothetical protein